jgi:hypothetical protein
MAELGAGPGRTDQPAEQIAEVSTPRLMMSIANQRLWVEAKPGSDPPAAGTALALAWEGELVEYLVCDTSESGAGNLEWVKASNVAKASIRAPRSTASLANQRLWIKSKPGTSPVAEGHALAVATDEQSSEYLACDESEGGGQLVWVDADDVDSASLKKVASSLLPTKKVTAAGVGGVAAGTLATAGAAFLETVGVDLTSEASAALTTLITALGAFVSAYARRDPAAVGTPAAEAAVATSGLSG